MKGMSAGVSQASIYRS